MVAGRRQLTGACRGQPVEADGDGGGRGRRSPPLPPDPPPGSGPVRTCVGCRRRAVQAELIRLVRAPDGSLRVGRTEPGRGAWLCRDGLVSVAPSCLDAAERRRSFARALRAPLRTEAVADLRSTLAPQAGGVAPSAD